ncbi:MAG TPA: aldose 1-epimerase family protein [Candidatus Dormibacteraeota bacterium]|nr:aldose 1-epimerase family protein [Candidatus Dormibacteraeota bacterium]
MSRLATVHGSGEQVILTAGEIRLVVVTWGGGMRELTHGDWSVLDGYGIDEVPVGAYGQPLIPWPNRLSNGRYEFRGSSYQVPLTEPEKQNALHGFARWMTWTVEQAEASRAVLGLVMYPRTGYPFTLGVEIEYTLEASGVSVVTTARNLGETPLPYANGFHPYISVGTSSIDGCTVRLPARTWMKTDDRQIPTGNASVEGTRYDFRSARPLAGERLDTAFTDLQRDNDGKARVRLTAPDGSRSVAVWMDAAYGYVMAFTGDTLADVARRRRSLGVEPMTAAPNALQTGEGLQVLDPGAESTSAWGIEIH